MLSTRMIKATEEYCTFQKSVCAPYIRKTFVLDAVPEKAAVTLTCTGFYRLYVNGRELTRSRLAPYISNPDELLFYDKYDITACLAPGRNVLGFWLGNGFSNSMSGSNWDLDLAPFRSAPMLAVSYESESLNFEADRSFVAAPSPVFFDDLRSGEFYDACREIPGWNEPDFDDSAWLPCIETAPARGKPLANAADPVVITEELKAVEIAKATIKKLPKKDCPMIPRVRHNSETSFYQAPWNEKGVVFKFAKNTACVPRLRIRGKKGQEIVIQAAEFCDEHNTVSYESMQSTYPYSFTQRDRYICSGNGLEEYIPSFTYHGARYFVVMGLKKEQISPDTLTMLVQNSALGIRGSFECSDPIADALYRNCRISDLSNFVFYPTDCPHREKHGWTGDAAMSAERMIMTLTPENSWNQWLRMIVEAQTTEGAIPGIVPTSGWGLRWGNGPVWDEVITELPYQTYRYRGDLALFDTVSDAVMRYLNYISKKRDRDGLIPIGLGDWCHALREGGSNHLCPRTVSSTAVVYDMCRKASVMYTARGLKPQAVFCDTLAAEVRTAFRTHLIDFGTMTVYGGCQTAQAAGLYYGLFDPGETPAAYARLLNFVHNFGDHFDSGMLGVRIIFRVLAEHGDAELAYRMITRTDAPSYGIYIEKFGLASMPESFHDRLDGGTTSLNHHFMGDIAAFFMSYIAGLRINPFGDDCRRIRVSPAFIPGMDRASASTDTPAGRVSVSWKRSGNTIKLHIICPDGIYGDITLPDGFRIASKSGEDNGFIHGRKVDSFDSDADYTVKMLS